MVKRESAGEVGENGFSIFVDGEQKVASRTKGYTANVATVGERKSVRLVAVSVSRCKISRRGQEGRSVLDQVEDGNAIANGREQTSTGWVEDEVTLAIHRSQKVGELFAQVTKARGTNGVTSTAANMP